MRLFGNLFKTIVGIVTSLVAVGCKGEEIKTYYGPAPAPQAEEPVLVPSAKDIDEPPADIYGPPEAFGNAPEPDPVVEEPPTAIYGPPEAFTPPPAQPTPKNKEDSAEQAPTKPDVEGSKDNQQKAAPLP